MKLEIYRRELNEYNMVGACGYVVNAKKPTTAVRRFTKAVKESNKLNEAEKERILEFVEDEKTFIETLDGKTHAGETNEYLLDLEEIEDGYWYVSVSASIEKETQEEQEEETVETPSVETPSVETPSVEQKVNYTVLERKEGNKKMKKLILLEKLRDTWTPNNENMFNAFSGFREYENETIKEFDNLDDGLQALKKCVPVDYSYPGKIEIISYALSVYENDVMNERYEWDYKKTEDGIVYKLEKTM